MRSEKVRKPFHPNSKPAIVIAAAILAIATVFTHRLHAQTQPADTQPGNKKPSDIQNAIGNLGLVRGYNRLAAPKNDGTWATLVDQPYFTPAIKAQKNLFYGQYEKAEMLYAGLLKENPDNQEYLENSLEAILSQGGDPDIARFVAQYDKLKDTQKSTAKMTRLRAQTYVLAGQSDKAMALLKTYVEAHPKPKLTEGPEVHLFVDYAQMLERAAQYAAASAVYTQVTDALGATFPDDPEAGVQLAIATYRGGRLSGDSKERAAMSELTQVRNEDQTYWPAYFGEAQILIAVHNEREAAGAMAQTMDLNPGSLDVQYLGITTGIAHGDLDGAMGQLNDLQKHTNEAKAKTLEGEILVMQSQPQDALDPLEESLKRDPSQPEAHGALAAAYFLLNKPDKMEAELSALKVDAGDGTTSRHPAALFTAAQILQNARQFAAAEKLYLEAQKGAPWWAEIPAALAEIYRAHGDEAKARAAYDQSYKLDSFNMRTVNQIKLLDVINGLVDKPAKSRLAPNSDQPAFVIKTSKQDEILAPLALDAMEQAKADLWPALNISSLPAPTLVEFFPTKEEFQMRTEGLPFVGQYGASLGNVIAMQIPRTGTKETVGVYDWARTLRHQYALTLILAATDNRVAPWLAQAFASAQEKTPRDWATCQLLASNFRAGKLYKINDLNDGISSKPGSAEHDLAIAQSQWLYEYLLATYGQSKVSALFAAFHEGMNPVDALKKTFGKSTDDVDAAFTAWAHQQIDAWKLPSSPFPAREDLEAAIKKNPLDPDALFALGFLNAGEGDNDSALANLQKALAVAPNNADAKELMGVIDQAAGDKAQARAFFESVAKDNPDRPLTLRGLGLLAMDAGKYDDAQKYFVKLAEVQPANDAPHAALAGIFLLNKQNKEAAEHLAALAALEQKDDRIARRLSDLELALNEPAKAQSAALQALHINAFSALNHYAMAQALIADKKSAEAVFYWQSAANLQPQAPEFWEGLAEAKGTTGDTAGAKEAAKKAVALKSTSTAAKWIKE